MKESVSTFRQKPAYTSDIKSQWEAAFLCWRIGAILRNAIQGTKSSKNQQDAKQDTKSHKKTENTAARTRISSCSGIHSARFSICQGMQKHFLLISAKCRFIRFLLISNYVQFIFLFALRPGERADGRALASERTSVATSFIVLVLPYDLTMTWLWLLWLPHDFWLLCHLCHALHCKDLRSMTVHKDLAWASGCWTWGLGARSILRKIRKEEGEVRRGCKRRSKRRSNKKTLCKEIQKHQKTHKHTHLLTPLLSRCSRWRA